MHVCVEVKIYDKMARCMLDTGAKISVIEYDIIKKIKTIKIDKSNLEVRCANGSQIKVKKRRN